MGYAPPRQPARLFDLPSYHSVWRPTARIFCTLFCGLLLCPVATDSPQAQRALFAASVSSYWPTSAVHIDMAVVSKHGKGHD
jgi:hypothetical protein